MQNNQKTIQLYSSVFFLIIFLIAQPLAAFACATCGCSELCPLAMMENDEQNNKTGTSNNSLSESLWGNIILKMAFQRDPQLQKLRKHGRQTNNLANTAIFSAVGGTLAQNIDSIGELNPQQGNDSYLPGSLGLGMSGLVNITLDSMMLYNWRLKRRIQARQLVVQKNVETILNHLEYSETACPEAQSQLSTIIGERAAEDCVRLWRSSHATAYAAKNKEISEKIHNNNRLENVSTKYKDIESIAKI